MRVCLCVCSDCGFRRLPRTRQQLLNRHPESIRALCVCPAAPGERVFSSAMHTIVSHRHAVYATFFDGATEAFWSVRNAASACAVERIVAFNGHSLFHHFRWQSIDAKHFPRLYLRAKGFLQNRTQTHPNAPAGYAMQRETSNRIHRLSMPWGD